MASPNAWEVPAEIQARNEADFHAKSANYADALKSLQLVLIVDHSGSQGAGDSYPHKNQPAPTTGILGGGWTQWDNTLMVTRYLAKTMFVYDKDASIPVVFFDNLVDEVACTHPDEMIAHFSKHRPRGTTNLFAALDHAFKTHIPADHSTKVLFIVLTDGCPDDERAVKRVIEEKVSRRDPKGEWLNILFIRIGDASGAIRFLQDMDDCREIGGNVDVKSDNQVYEMGPQNLILNAIFEHLEGQLHQRQAAPMQYQQQQYGGQQQRGQNVGQTKQGGGGCCSIM